METLKFLMVTTHFPPRSLGGDAMFVKYLSEELTKRGHEVHVFHKPSVYEALRGDRSPPAGGATQGLTLHEQLSGGSRAGLALSLALNWSGHATEELMDLAKEVRPDVIHWHNTKGFIGRPLSVGVPVGLYTAHDYYAVCQRSNLQRPDLSFCRRPRACTICSIRWGRPPQLWRMGPWRVLRMPESTRILCPSEFISNRLAEDGIAGSHIVRNFVPDRFNGRTLSSGAHSLVFLGVLEMHKGPLTLLEAFGTSSERQGLDLHFIGDGSLRSTLAERIRELGLEKRVFVHGYLPRGEVDALLADAAALVVPSEWPENAPLAVLEAMSMGLPTLGSDQGGLPEILGPESGSIIFPAGDKGRLADAIVSVWERRMDTSPKMMARRAYENYFSPDVHLRLYFSILKDRHAGASDESKVT